MPESSLNIDQVRNKGGSSETGTRKVSSRRKALQDFYRINNESKSQTETDEAENSPQSGSEGPDNYEEFIKDPSKLDEYVKNSSIENIIKVRNQITGKLNSQNQTKKSIIYDNYYELIKLSQILNGILSGSTMSKNQSDGFKVLAGDELKVKKDADYVDEVLRDLSNFVSSEVDSYNGDFETVITRMKADASRESESTTSREVPKVDKLSQIDSNDAFTLTQEISTLLKNDPTEIPGDVKSSLLSDIQGILKKLRMPEDELLIIQLNQLEAKLA